MFGGSARLLGAMVAVMSAVTLAACGAKPAEPTAGPRWVETQQLPPDLGVELPEMPPGLAEEFEGAETAWATPSPQAVDAQPTPPVSGYGQRAAPVSTVPAGRRPLPIPTNRGPAPPWEVPDPNLSPIPLSGSRTFTAATGSTGVVGDGSKLVTYRVEVEGGIPGWYPELFADRVDPILADTRSWRAAHKWSFKRVPAGTTPSLYIRLATPKTVDYFCNPYGIQTAGKYSCRYGKVVLINLARWVNAVPGFGTDLLGYRRMVINHEVGHFLGHGHVLCPGTGKLAPVMQTQTISLRGCRPNSWPYPDGVHYITGPAA